MAGAVDGLVSGLDTSTIITQLMQLERAPQDRLKTARTQNESSITALRSLNTRILNVMNAAKSLGTATGWNAATATTSDATRAGATSTAGALSGELTFAVKQLASAAVWKSAGTVATVDTVVAAADSSFTITKDGVSKSVSVGDGKLGSVVTAINAAGAGVTASAVQVSPGAFALQLSSTTPGETAISIGSSPFTAPLGALAELTAGRNAKVQVGVAADGTGGYEVVRTSNTVNDLLKGTTITLVKQDPSTALTVRVASDSGAVADGVAKLIDNLNSVLGEITRTGSYDAATKTAGVLHGEGAVRALRSQLTTAVMGGPSNNPSVAGVSVQRDGTVAFDRAKFLTALSADPTGVMGRLGAGTPDTVVGGVTVPGVPGLSARLSAVAESATRGAGSVGGTGTVTAAITNRERSTTQLSGDITKWDSRLKMRQERLVAQFARLETALGSAQSQGQWLAGQIAGLPSWG